jgi:hypothetical protein
MRRPLTISSLTALLGAAIIAGCTNPFAPKLDQQLNPTTSTLGDQRTVDGVFQNIQYAYTYRDTLIYSNLLHPDFRFQYYNADKGQDVTFYRDEEMQITNRIFRGADQVELQWNDFVSQEGDSLLMNVKRSYTLKIVLQTSQVYSIDGYATLRLVRETPNDVWLIRIWYDASNS